jgi:hypothetical protein
VRHRIIFALKLTLAGVIIAALLYNIQTGDPEALEELLSRKKDWLDLGAALLLTTLAVSLTFVRWCILVRTLEIPFRVRDAFRFGFLGYTLNFVSPGSTGGDFFKAIFIARQVPGRRAEAVATVIVDRLIGLYALFVVTSLAILTADLRDLPPVLVGVCQLAHVCTGVGGAAVLVLMLPGFTTGNFWERLSTLPKIGPTISQLILAMRMYRRRVGLLLGIGVMSMGIHALFILGVFMAAGAISPTAPNVSESFVIVPLGMVAGAIPLVPGGLGTFEGAMEYLYDHMPATETEAGLGLFAALAYRLMTVVIAMLGICYYLADRRQIREAMDEMDEMDAAPQAAKP